MCIYTLFIPPAGTRKGRRKTLLRSPPATAWLPLSCCQAAAARREEDGHSKQKENSAVFNSLVNLLSAGLSGVEGQIPDLSPRI